MAKLSFANAEKERDKITAQDRRELSRLYQDWAESATDDIHRILKKGDKQTFSDRAKARMLLGVVNKLETASSHLVQEVEGKLKSSMYTIADAVVRDNTAFLKTLGIKADNEFVSQSFSIIPMNIVEMISEGQIYKEGWKLSKAIWGDNKDTIKRLRQTIAGGIAQNKSTFQIAKEIENFVSPNAKKQWNLKAPDGKRIYPKQVDYAAQRLSRTVKQHAYQQSFIATTKDNPLVVHYQWDANGSRVCPICKARDGHVYAKDELPMDHPQGMCTMVPVEAPNVEKKLADWVKGNAGDDPAMDEWMKKLGYDPEQPGHTKPDIIDPKIIPSVQNITPAPVPPPSRRPFDPDRMVEDFEHDRSQRTALSNQFDGLLKEISDAQMNAIQQYTTNAGINEYLRGNDDLSYNPDAVPRAEKQIRDISSALAKSKLESGVTVFRSITERSLASVFDAPIDKRGYDDGKSFLENVTAGTIFVDEGFVSTSVGYKGMNNIVNLYIEVPKGSQAAYISSISDHPGESELLLQKGGRFIVEGVRYNEDKQNGRYEVFARLVNNGAQLEEGE